MIANEIQLMFFMANTRNIVIQRSILLSLFCTHVTSRQKHGTEQNMGECAILFSQNYLLPQPVCVESKFQFSLLRFQKKTRREKR